MTPPPWLDAHGRRRPRLACWTCGREVAPMRFRAADLRPHGWRPAQTLQIPEWWGGSTTTCGRFTWVSMVLVVLAMASLFAVTSAGADERLSRRGPYEGGQYEIEVPANWNGGLVLYAHGFRGGLHSPLASHLTERGYALAGSS